MKINNAFYITIFLFCILNARFGGWRKSGGMKHNRSQKTSRHLSHNKQRQQHKQQPSNNNSNSSKKGNNYSHGGRNNFNNMNNYGSIGNAAGWGLVGGLGMGLLLGATLSNANPNNSENITIINSNDTKDKDTTKNNVENSTNLIKELKSDIKEIENIYTQISTESSKITENNIPSFIKTNFTPYKKIDIIKITSNELYGDFKKDKVEIVNFKGDQEIEKLINITRRKIQTNFSKLKILNANKENKAIIEEIQTKLINTLKVLNSTLVETVRKLQE